MVQDTSKIKERIISIFKTRGPSLPIHISREIKLSLLFTSAFLSELMAENKIKTSHMRVGSSPIYFIPGQEFKVEKFSHFLKSKEKEVFILLKEKKILKDSEQQPAIRVALRALKDFAIPFEKDNEIYWKYLEVSEENLKEFIENKKEVKEDSEKNIEIPEENKKTLEEIKETPKEIKKSSNPIRKEKVKKITKPKNSKQSKKFLEKIKEFLSKSSIEISSIESIGKNELFLKVKENNNESLLVAYNEKRISEKEIIKASKKASELNLKYSIIFLGKLPKKTSDLINALQNLIEIGKVE